MPSKEIYLLQISRRRGISPDAARKTLAEMAERAKEMAKLGMLGTKMEVEGNIKQDPFCPELILVLEKAGYELDYINFFYFKKVEGMKPVNREMDWFNGEFLPEVKRFLGPNAVEEYNFRASQEPGVVYAEDIELY